MKIDVKVPTTKKHVGKNTCEILLIHHTWWSLVFQNQVNYLSKHPDQASVQFVVWQLWEVAQIWNVDDILWHAWKSQWKWRQDKFQSINSYAIGIEVVWPWFTEVQKEKVWELIIFLSEKYKINQENIIRHKDVTSRKVDIDDSFWNQKFKSWNDYIKFLFTKKEIMGEFAKFEWFELSTQSEKDYETPATVWDVKDLLEVMIFRYHEQKEAWTLKKRAIKK